MYYDHKKEKEKLLSATDPDMYIDYSFKSKIAGRAKSIITREWLHKTGYTIDDIQEARNRHPHWKKLKAKGSYERTMKRLKEHDYRESGNKVIWDRDKVSKFYDLNKEGHTDYELAKVFKTTLPSVNHIRRKLIYSTRILEVSGSASPTKAKVLEMAMTAEKTLKLKMQTLTGSTSSRIPKNKKKAASAPVSKKRKKQRHGTESPFLNRDGHTTD